MDFSRFSIEGYALKTRWSGMEILAMWTARIEAAEKTPAGKPGSNVLVRTTFGSGPNDTEISNYFLWYSTSFAAFVQIFDKAAGTSLGNLPEFKGVTTWRHKVAAHTAYVVPKPADSLATQEASITMYPVWRRGIYEMGGFVTVGPQGSSNTDWKWSLTETHKALRDHLARILI